MLELVRVPTEADAEDEATARQLVERCHRLGGDDRLALGDEADAGPEQDPLGDRGGDGEGHERIQRPLVLLGELGVPRRRGGAARDRDVRVLGEVDRMQPTVLDGRAKSSGRMV